jgi:cell division protein FtsW
MGMQTYVKPGTRPPTYSKNAFNILDLDLPLLVSVIVLVVFGLLMVYSASWNYSLRSDEPVSYILSRQIIWVIIGTSVAAFLCLLDYKKYIPVVIPMMAVTLLMLIVVLIINDNPTGPSRTLFRGSVQPSELAKLVVIIYLSVFLAAKGELLNNIGFGLVPVAGILALIGSLILMEPDISAAVTIVILGGLLFFLAGVDFRQIVIILLVIILFGWGVVTLTPTGSARIESYLGGLQSPENASYHVKRAMEAVVNGGLFGVGIGKSNTKFTGLPVPWTDSVFAVISEETGLIGSVFTIVLFLVILWRGLLISKRAPDMLGKLLSAGMTLWICLEAFVNIAVMINLLPIAGNALPMVSAGGSNMVMSLAAIGIIMSVARTSYKATQTSERRTQSAVVDLRRRDGRRRVPRSSRITGSGE